jgi:hypothetical protein
MNPNILLVGGFSAFSTAAGLAVGYLVAKKDLETHYNLLARQEIAEAKLHYSRIYKRDAYESPAAAVKALIPETDDKKVNAAADALLAYQGDDDGEPPQISQQDAGEALYDQIDEAVEEEQSGTVIRNVFQTARTVDENVPHVITQEEFEANETGFDQSSLCWYEGDNVLTDERDEPIQNSDEVVGDENLKEFNNLGEDEHQIFIRSPKIKMEFEVSRSTGKYVEEVLGLRGS